MKEIKLKKLILKNWRGQSRDVEFSNNTEIRGRNKSGKSSVFNAFLWLILGVDESDRVNYQLFDNRVEQTHDNSKVASVEGTIEFDDVEYVISRTAEVGWTRERGKTEYKRKGTDNYKFYVDSIEKSATDYKKFIEEKFAPIDKLKIMLNIRYFLSLDWKVMRKHLESLVGEIKGSDFQGDYSLIQEDLKKYSMEELKEYYRKQLKPIKENMEKIPEQIKALKATIPSESDIRELEKVISEAKSQIESIDAKMLGSAEALKTAMAERDAVLSKINSLKEDYSVAEAEYNRDSVNKANEIKSKMDMIDFENKSIKRNNDLLDEQKKEIEKSIQNLTHIAENAEKKHKELLEKNKECKERVFTGDKCSYCGQVLPEGMLEEAKSKFEAQKEKDHQAIVKEGKVNREIWNETLEAIEKNKKQLEEGFEYSPLKDKTSLEAELSVLRANFVKYAQTTEGAEKLAKIKDMESKLVDVPSQDNGNLTKMKKQLMDDIVDTSKKIGTKDTILEDIAKKEKDLKDNSIASAKLEGKINAVVEYEREKASIIYYRVNNKFDYASVEMTDTDKSGNIIDTCRVLDEDGVNASVTNFASYMRCCIDLSTAFCKFYGVNLPLFVDFAESITEDNYPESGRQTIKLIVDDCDFNVKNE